MLEAEISSFIRVNKDVTDKWNAPGMGSFVVGISMSYFHGNQFVLIQAMKKQAAA